VDIPCVASDLATWNDGDSGTGVSSAVTFDTKSCFSFLSGNSTSERNKDVGSIDGLGSRIVCSISLYNDKIALAPGADNWAIFLYRSDVAVLIQFGSNGLFIYDGGSYNEVGTDLVSQDAWQEWTFDIHNFGTPANADCDVYLNGSLEVSDVDCSHTGSYTDGNVVLKNFGTVNTDNQSYLNWLKIGDGFAA
jgi:hypothetical protein